MNDADDRINSDLADSVSWQGFVYLSESSDCHTASWDRTDRSPAAPQKSSDPVFYPLSSRRLGDRVRIAALNCGEANNRLMGMGLIPGAVLEVMSCTATGSVIVALQNQRLGLGADMAQQIQVSDLRVNDSQVNDSQINDSQVNNAAQLGERPSRIPTRMTTMQTMQTISPISPDASPVKLRDVAIGTRLRVRGYEPTARDYKRKLLAMGLTPGTELRVTRHAPLGDPTEISVRGFQLSLRKAEADALIVVPVMGS